MSVARYTIGPPTRPAIQHDNGFLDKFLPRKPTSADYARRAVWLAKLEGVEALQCLPLFPHNDLPDALAAYRHFLAGNGKGILLMKVLLIFIVVVAVLGIALSLTVCKKKNEDKKSILIRTDMQEISWLLKPQLQPKAAWFTITRLGSKATPLAPGPEDYRYSAVLLFDTQDIDQLLKQAKSESSEFSPANEYFASLPELHLLLKEHGTLEGKVYDASGIVRNGGSMVRIKGTNKLFVTYTTR